MPSIDVDRDGAHQLAQDELNKPIYTHASPTEKLDQWLNHLLYRLFETTAHIPGGWFTTTLLFILLVIAIVVAVRVIQSTLRTNRRGDSQLFEAVALTAAQHRATAEGYAAEGNWAAAIRHRLRVVARELEESGVLNPNPGRTANELARDAGDALPHLDDELSQAATAFNDVTYGERPGTQAAYQMIADLDDHLRSRSTAAAAATVHHAPTDSWAQVR